MFFLNRHPRYMHWQIAYRMKGDRAFRVVSNPPYAWAADPFLVTFDGRLYLFAELFLFRSERNGVIGYCEYTRNGFGDWTVSMDEHWHLSYPNVFVRNGKLAMCPETYQKREIGIYELIDFPNRWVLADVLVSNMECVDTTFLHHNGEEYMFTFLPEFQNDEGALLMLKKQRNGTYSRGAVITRDKGIARPGGNFVHAGKKLYRVSQNCEHSYGESVVISEVLCVEPVYGEKIVRSISPHNTRIDTRKKVLGIHTYNRLGDMEVIDFKYYAPSLSEMFAARRTKRVFTNKY